MNNPEKLATLGTQDTRHKTNLGTGHITKTKHKPQHRKVKPWATRILPVNPGNPGSRKSKQFLFLIRHL